MSTDSPATPVTPNAAESPAVPQARVLVDPYRDWSEAEGIPIHLDFGHNLLELETGPWDRYEAKGCFAHTHGAGDFMANYVLEVAPGAKTRPVRHLYEVFHRQRIAGSTGHGQGHMECGVSGRHG